jgi:hypothetical protein
MMKQMKKYLVIIYISGGYEPVLVHVVYFLVIRPHM